MLEIQGITKVYPGGVEALKGISLSVPKGMFGLLGPNGAGKTTLMRILSGLLEPTSGQVLLDGQDVIAHPEELWPRLGNLPQYFGFYPHLTGRAMLQHLLELKGVVGPEGLAPLVDDLLDRVNLQAAAGRKVKTYSGGMRQRLGIAQAIAGDPDLIIVDEPTAGLDPEERLRFYRLLAELAEDRTVLLSTHIVDDVAMLCPQFAVIRSGELVATTTPSAAKAEIAGTVFEGLVETSELAALEEERRLIRAHLVEGRNAARVHAPDGVVPEGFASSEPTLEDAYLIMMRRKVSLVV